MLFLILQVIAINSNIIKSATETNIIKESKINLEFDIKLYSEVKEAYVSHIKSTANILPVKYFSEIGFNPEAFDYEYLFYNQFTPLPSSLKNIVYYEESNGRILKEITNELKQNIFNKLSRSDFKKLIKESNSTILTNLDIIKHIPKDELNSIIGSSIKNKNQQQKLIDQEIINKLVKCKNWLEKKSNDSKCKSNESIESVDYFKYDLSSFYKNLNINQLNSYFNKQEIQLIYLYFRLIRSKISSYQSLNKIIRKIGDIILTLGELYKDESKTDQIEKISKETKFIDQNYINLFSNLTLNLTEASKFHFIFNDYNKTFTSVKPILNPQNIEKIRFLNGTYLGTADNKFYKLSQDLELNYQDLFENVKLTNDLKFSFNQSKTQYLNFNANSGYFIKSNAKVLIPATEFSKILESSTKDGTFTAVASQPKSELKINLETKDQLNKNLNIQMKLNSNIKKDFIQFYTNLYLLIPTQLPKVDLTKTLSKYLEHIVYYIIKKISSRKSDINIKVTLKNFEQFIKSIMDFINKDIEIKLIKPDHYEYQYNLFDEIKELIKVLPKYLEFQFNKKIDVFKTDFSKQDIQSFCPSVILNNIPLFKDNMNKYFIDKSIANLLTPREFIDLFGTIPSTASQDQKDSFKKISDYRLNYEKDVNDCAIKAFESSFEKVKPITFLALLYFFI